MKYLMYGKIYSVNLEYNLINEAKGTIIIFLLDLDRAFS